MVITNKKVTMKKEKIKNTQYRNSFFFYNSADRLHCVLFALWLKTIL